MTSMYYYGRYEYLISVYTKGFKRFSISGYRWLIWWRWRELNPRPQILCLWLYMLIPVY